MKTTRRARRRARSLYRSCIQGGLVDEDRARKAAALVARSGRRGRLPVLAHFQRLLRLDAARHRARVESASILPADLRAGIEAGLARLYGPGLRTSYSEEPALIAGVRISVASDVYDGSVRAALRRLQERF
jgi:F-type H+-transporting ATPase subunit delta